MYSKKRICIFLSAAAILTTGAALELSNRANLGKTQADGGGPTPPPIPWPVPPTALPHFIADGGGPTPPPIPWGPANTDEQSLRS